MESAPAAFTPHSFSKLRPRIEYKKPSRPASRPMPAPTPTRSSILKQKHAVERTSIEAERWPAHRKQHGADHDELAPATTISGLEEAAVVAARRPLTAPVAQSTLQATPRSRRMRTDHGRDPPLVDHDVATSVPLMMSAAQWTLAAAARPAVTSSSLLLLSPSSPNSEGGSPPSSPPKSPHPPSKRPATRAASPAIPGAPEGSLFSSAPIATEHGKALARFEDASRVQGLLRWLRKRGKAERLETELTQIGMLRRWFEMLDADVGGGLSADELEHPLMAIGFIAGRADLEDMISQYTMSENSDEIDFAGFVQMFRAFDHGVDGARKNAMRTFFNASGEGSRQLHGTRKQGKNIAASSGGGRPDSDEQLDAQSMSLFMMLYTRREMLDAFVAPHEEERLHGQRVLANFETRREQQRRENVASISSSTPASEANRGGVSKSFHVPLADFHATDDTTKTFQRRRTMAQAIASAAGSADGSGFDFKSLVGKVILANRGSSNNSTEAAQASLPPLSDSNQATSAAVDSSQAKTLTPNPSLTEAFGDQIGANPSLPEVFGNPIGRTPQPANTALPRSSPEVTNKGSLDSHPQTFIPPPTMRSSSMRIRNSSQNVGVLGGDVSGVVGTSSGQPLEKAARLSVMAAMSEHGARELRNPYRMSEQGKGAIHALIRKSRSSRNSFSEQSVNSHEDALATPGSLGRRISDDIGDGEQ